MILPDYRGGSIVNLMASISRGLGAPRVGIPEARLLPAHQIGRARHVVLLMLDGLGYEYLVSYRDALLRRYLLGELTSVFPSATAIAVTTFATGMTPRQHGVTGWHMYMEELDRVCTVLPFRDRVTRDAGSFIAALEAGVVTEDHVHAELGEVVAGVEPGRTSDEEITVFDSGGTGIETVAAAHMLYERAREEGLGTEIPFAPASEALTGD